MKILETNYYGLDHKAVAKKFEGDPQYIRTFCFRHDYHPWAVYKVAKPNKAKGHKKYMLLRTFTGFDGVQRLYVTGTNPQFMAHERLQDAALCKTCGQVIYSVMRHHQVSCECGATSIDGGKDYVRTTGDPKLVLLDLLTGQIIPTRRAKSPRRRKSS